jgi:hypothetical protein
LTKKALVDDLIVLAADKSMKLVVEKLLDRSIPLRIRPISSYVVTLTGDATCYTRCDDFLRSFVGQYRHAMVMFDREGCGQEIEKNRTILEREIEGRLARSGWDDRAAAIVLDPELEIWVWTESSHVDHVLGWEGKHPDLRAWLTREGWLQQGQLKPSRPKEAMKAAIRKSNKGWSSALHAELAGIASFRRCIDPAFSKFKSTLQTWFAEES